MRTLFEAVADAQPNYVPGTRVNAFTGDMNDIQARKSTGICACRGMCSSHTGPCSMQSSKEVKGNKFCKACAIAAGGPGSGRHPEYSKMATHLKSKGFSKEGYSVDKSGTKIHNFVKDVLMPHQGDDAQHIIEVNEKNAKFKGWTNPGFGDDPAVSKGSGLNDLVKHVKGLKNPTTY